MPIEPDRDEPEGFVVTNQRLPIPLHQQLRQAAKQSLRSLNSEIIVRLREFAALEGVSHLQNAAHSNRWGGAVVFWAW